MINLKDIDYIAAVASSGGIQKAAKAISLSQPALTKRIRNLEDSLELKLFDRLAKGVRLTQAGEVFLAEGQKLVTHSHDFQNIMKAYQEGRGGLISLGVKPGLENAFFRRSVVEYIRKYPETNLQISIDATPTLANKIRDGQIDFAMGALGYSDEHGSELVLSNDLEFEPLFNIPLEIIVRKGHPVLDNQDDLTALFDYPIICPTPPLELFNNLKNAYLERGTVVDRPHIQVDDYSIIYELLERSDMWSATFASNHTKLELADKFVILGQSPLLPSLTIGLVKRKTWAINPNAKNLIDIMKFHAKIWSI